MTIQRRPVVIVDDHLYHIGQILSLLNHRAPDLLERVTVVCLARRGPDTCADVARWHEAYPEVMIVADLGELESGGCLVGLPPEVFERGPSYAQLIASALTPCGILIQDIQLETLRSVPTDRWWESIYLANTVRGMFGSGHPRVVFMSNKAGFQPTFGRQLVEVGFDPRDVMLKDELPACLVPRLRQQLHEAFPLMLELGGVGEERWLSGEAEEREALEAELDLISWEERGAWLGLSGRALNACVDRLDCTGNEAQTWKKLVEAHLLGRAGLSSVSVGERVGKEGAERAELTNAAARHINRLRGRLADREALQTVAHHYRLADELQVGRVRRRARD